MSKLSLMIFVFIFTLSYQSSSKASLIISNINLTSTTLSFDVTGILDFVNRIDRDSLFFGDVTQLSNLFNSINTSTVGFSNNSGTYAFNMTGGNSSDVFGKYLYTNGSDFLVIGDFVDISVSWTGIFNVSEFDWSNFVVQAGYHGPSVFTERANISGGVVVPEPSNFALLCLGIASILVGRRNKIT